MFKAILIGLAVLVGLVLLVPFGVWLALRAPDTPWPVLEAKYATPQSHFVDLPGDVRLHYVDEGDPAKPTLILLHGFGDSFLTWRPWAERLRKDFRVISLDLPGHGLTHAPAEYRAQFDAYSDLVGAFADKVGLSRFALAGNSMGGGVAWRFAADHPERVSALVLVDAAGWPPSGPPKAPPLAFRIMQYPIGRAFLRSINNRPLVEQGLKADVYDKSVVTKAFIDQWSEVQLAPGHRTILMSILPGARAEATPEVLAKITAPTLILHGEADHIIEPEASRRFHAAISGSQLILYPKAGHLPQWEIPERSASDTAAFLKAHIEPSDQAGTS